MNTPTEHTLSTAGSQSGNKETRVWFSKNTVIHQGKQLVANQMEGGRGWRGGDRQKESRLEGEFAECVNCDRDRLLVQCDHWVMCCY